MVTNSVAEGETDNVADDRCQLSSAELSVVGLHRSLAAFLQRYLAAVRG